MIKLFKRFWRWLCKTKTRTLSLFFAFILAIAFTVAVFIVCNNGGMIPDSLIYCVYGFIGLVVVMSGAISIKSFRIGDVEMDLSKDETEE